MLHWDSSSLCPTSAWASVICPPFPQTVSLMLPTWCCPELPYRLLTGQHNERHKRSVMLLNMCVLIATVRRDSGYTAQLGKRTSTPQKTPLIWLKLFTKMGRNLCEKSSGALPHVLQLEPRSKTIFIFMLHSSHLRALLKKNKKIARSTKLPPVQQACLVHKGGNGAHDATGWTTKELIMRSWKYAKCCVLDKAG